MTRFPVPGSRFPVPGSGSLFWFIVLMEEA
jgi:hypothetical protein